MQQKLPKNHLFRIVFPLIYGSVVYLLILLVFENFGAVSTSFFSNEWIFTVSLTFVVSESLHFTAVFISRKLIFSRNIAVYITAQFLASCFLVFLLVLAGIHFYFIKIEGFSVYTAELRVFETFFMITAILYNMYIFSFLLLNEENTKLTELETELALKNDLLIQSLENEINPELLFSSLEALIIKTRYNQHEATDLIGCLSSFYRFRLNNKFNELINLSNELEATENLVQLLNYSNKGKIILHSAKNEVSPEFTILPGLICRIVTIIANTNILTEESKFEISIFPEEDLVRVLHPYQEKILVSESDEIEKIAEVFYFFSQRKLKFKKHQQLVEISVPVIKNEDH